MHSKGIKKGRWIRNNTQTDREKRTKYILEMQLNNTVECNIQREKNNFNKRKNEHTNKRIECVIFVGNQIKHFCVKKKPVFTEKCKLFLPLRDKDK